MAKLTAAQQLFCIDRLAEFETPKAVAEALHETFGVTVARQSVEWYDPAKNPSLARKWNDRFAERRAGRVVVRLIGPAGRPEKARCAQATLGRQCGRIQVLSLCGIACSIARDKGFAGLFRAAVRPDST